MSRIAVLGTGAMGSRVTQNLLNANHQVVVYNRSADKVQPLLEQGAVYAATPRAAAQQANFVISMVTNDEVSRIIWLDSEIGAVLGLGNDAIAIESSTLTVEWTQELAASIENYGAMFLDAPVVGSRPQAEAEKLIYLLGGQTETVAQAHAVLSSAGGAAIYHIGATGHGMAMKLAVNALFGIQVAALAEILGMLTQQGIDLTTAIACLADLPVTSPAAKIAASLMVAKHHAPLFPISLVEKDFRYAIQTAQAVAAATPISIATRDIYQAAIAQGYGSDNITGVAQLFI